MRSRGNAVIGMVASCALAACHGDDTTTSTTAAPPAPVVSSAGKTFTGTVSFGDTVVIQLDTPSTGQATVTFPHSQYGLTGTYVQPYSWTTSTGTTAAVALPVQSGMGVLASAMKKIVGAAQALAATFVPSAFAQTAPTGAPPAAAGASGSAGVAGLSVGTLAAVGSGVVAVAAVAAAAASSSNSTGASGASGASSTSSTSSTSTPLVLTGTLSVDGPFGNLLTGGMIASNQFSLQGATVNSELASLPGTYSFIKVTSNITNGVPVSSDTSLSGQMSIASDGTVTVCPYESYSSTCASPITGSVSASADQTTVPGTLDFKLNGQLLGQALVLTQSDGTHSLVVDQTVSDTGASGVAGGWTIVPSQTIGFDQLDGNWDCTEQSFSGAAANNFAAVFNESNFPIAGVSTGITTDNFTLVPSTDPTGTTQPQAVAATGLVAAEGLTFPSGGVTQVNSASNLVFLPVGTQSLAFLDGLNTPGKVTPGVCTFKTALAAAQ